MNKCQFINAVTKRMCNNSGLPIGYKKLDYIESTSTSTSIVQSIDTLIPCSNTIYVDITMAIPSTYIYDNSSVLMGAYREGSTWYGFAFPSSAYIRIPTWQTGFINYYLGENLTTNKMFNIYYSYGSVKYNGTQIATAYPVTDNTTTIHLFDRYDHAASVRMYHVKIGSGYTLLRDMYAALRKSDRKPGMYDTVTKTFFTNQGTGEFLYG